MLHWELDIFYVGQSWWLLKCTLRQLLRQHVFWEFHYNYPTSKITTLFFYAKMKCNERCYYLVIFCEFLINICYFCSLSVKGLLMTGLAQELACQWAVNCPQEVHTGLPGMGEWAAYDLKWGCCSDSLRKQCDRGCATGVMWQVSRDRGGGGYFSRVTKSTGWMLDYLCFTSPDLLFLVFEGAKCLGNPPPPKKKTGSSSQTSSQNPSLSISWGHLFRNNLAR